MSDQNVKSSKIRETEVRISLFGQDGRTGLKFTFQLEMNKQILDKILKSNGFKNTGHQQQRTVIPNNCKHSSNKSSYHKQNHNKS